MRFRSKAVVFASALCLAAVVGSVAVAQEVKVTNAGVSSEEFHLLRPANYHVVQPGDTLFTLATLYFGTPYAWPLIWSYNDHISNPHWIYPGDVVYMRPPLPGDAPDEQGVTPFVQSSSGTSIALAGFLTKRDLKPIGKLSNSPANKNMLSFPDKVYVSVNDKDQVKKGKLFAVLRLENQEEQEDESVVSRFKVVGAVRITEPSDGDDKLHKAVIVQSWEEIYRGDLLYPYERQLLRVAPSVATDTVTGSILDTVERRTLFGEHFYVLINKGKKEGVRVGNRFFAYSREDGRSELDEDDIAAIPYERQAQMLVIHAEDNYSTALVVESKRELKKGWHVEMYEGF